MLIIYELLIEGQAAGDITNFPSMTASFALAWCIWIPEKIKTGGNIVWSALPSHDELQDILIPYGYWQVAEEDGKVGSREGTH